MSQGTVQLPREFQSIEADAENLVSPLAETSTAVLAAQRRPAKWADFSPFKWLWLSKPMVSHFGVGSPPILVDFSGDWDVHWGYGILTHGQIRPNRALLGQTQDAQGRGTCAMHAAPLSVFPPKVPGPRFWALVQGGPGFMYGHLQSGSDCCIPMLDHPILKFHATYPI